MKKLIYFFLAMTAISSLTLTTSCADDDDNNGNQNNGNISTAVIIDSLCNVVEYADTFSLSEGNGLYGFRFSEDGKMKLDIFTEYYDSLNDKPCMYPLTANLVWELIETPVAKVDGLTYYAIHCMMKKADNAEFNHLADSLYQTGLLDEPVELADEDLDTLYISVNDTTAELTLYVVDEEAQAEVEAGQTRNVWEKFLNIFVKPTVELAVKIIEIVDYEIGVAGDKTRGDWMANINDSVPICKISIPGTHDTFTYSCLLSANFAKTQELNLEEQWAVGVRCFDMRFAYIPEMALLAKTVETKQIDVEDVLKLYPSALRFLNCIYMGGVDLDGTPEYTPLQFCHGSFIDDKVTVLLHRNVERSFDQLKELLENHPKETAVVILKFDYNDNQEGRLLMDEFISKQMKDSLVVEWKPGIKLGDARGKIVVVARYPSKIRGVGSALSANSDGTVGGGVWGDNRSDSYLMDLGEKEKWSEHPDKIAPLLVQDLYEIGNGHTFGEKQSYAQTNLEVINIPKYVNSYTWAFNHMSGLTMKWGNFLFMNYPQNANVMNPYIEELIQKEKYKSYYTGIIPLDWAGWSELMSGGIEVGRHYNTWGATTPGTIINHNVNLKWHYADGTTFPFTTKQSL